jgi:hypothetical protein
MLFKAEVLGYCEMFRFRVTFWLSLEFSIEDAVGLHFGCGGPTLPL